VLHHTPDIEAAVGEIHRVLKTRRPREFVMLYHRGSYNYRLGNPRAARAGADLLKTDSGIRSSIVLTGERLISCASTLCHKECNGDLSAADF